MSCPTAGRASGPRRSGRSACSRPGTSVEVLIPDFCGKWDALQLVLDEKPEILNHNLETVPRLYRTVRPQAKYARSLKLLQIAKDQGLTTKTGIMLGLGEEARGDRIGHGRPGRHPRATS